MTPEKTQAHSMSGAQLILLSPQVRGQGTRGLLSRRVVGLTPSDLPGSCRRSWVLQSRVFT